MEHKHFKPKDLKSGVSAVTGHCNNVPAEKRYQEETPLFAKKIIELLPKDIERPCVMDYGCGVGRLAKEVLAQRPETTMYCIDDSRHMLGLATDNLSSHAKHTYFLLPHELEPPIIARNQLDVVYCVYVLQHMPAIEIRDAIQRMYYYLKDDGKLFYCSSDYRMCVRYDNDNFYDDRFLGVNLQEELSRFFEFERFAFTQAELDSNPTVKRLVLGKWDKVGQIFNPQLLKDKKNPVWDWDETHLAFVYHKRKHTGRLFNSAPLKDYDITPPPDVKIEKLVHTPANFNILADRKEITDKLVLVNKLSPGDILVMTVAIRCLHQAYPGRFTVDVRTPTQEIFENSPHITKIDIKDKKAEVQVIEELKKDEEHLPIVLEGVTFLISHYPDIHQSGWSGLHFSDGHRRFLAKQLGLSIPRTGMRPDIFLSQTEKDWASPFTVESGNKEPYWVINAGSKGDYTLKQYPYYQEVVDLLKDKITLVQIGAKSHNHVPLKGDHIFDMVGKTPNMRQLFRLIFHAEGVITCISLAHHIAAAMQKSCVSVAGGREPVRWEMYPSNRYLAINGCCPAGIWDGCWRSKKENCPHLIEGIPLCMKLIRPEDVARSVELFYLGGVLQSDKIKSLI